MLSCDTFALNKKFFEENENLFAKNSDRPLGEAQPLFFCPNKKHRDGETVSCTHLTIPQMEETYAVIGCKPYWIWGFETGLNEYGLVIGNEAQGSRCEVEKEEGLLGMDLLRLALERSRNAREAIDVIAALLEKYGQNANASMLFDRRYENSYLMVDKKEIWLMETAGRQWVAKQIHDWSAISNCYSIGKDYDICSEKMEQLVRDNRWMTAAEPVDFAKAYTLPAVRQTNSVPRWRRMKKLISMREEALNISDVKKICRDHFEGELIEPRFGASYGGFVSICMHAMTWDASQTASSFLMSYHDQLGVVCRYAPSIPCCSVYIPIYWIEELPEMLIKGDAVYDEKSLWWVVETLAMAVSIDEERFGKNVREELRELEAQIEKEKILVEEQACVLLKQEKVQEAHQLLKELTETSAEQLMETAKRLTREICECVKSEGGLYGVRKEFLTDYCKRAKLPLL